MKIRLIVTLGIILGLAGCTEPGETTAVGAASGGVLGAGLGAIVGNQTGDPGAGMVIGAMAGAGAGAAVGNALEAQQQAIRTQDEAIERQQNLIAAQNAELNELRAINRDSGVGRQDMSPRRRSVPANEPRASMDRDAFVEKSIPTRVEAAEPPQPAPLAARQVEASAPESDSCSRAKEEARKAEAAVESSDKLFHYRRALRLCPGVASYHNAIGETYAGLGRAEDARFEFEEALKASPNDSEARRNLQLLDSSETR